MANAEILQDRHGWHLPELPYIEEVRDGTFTMLEYELDRAEIPSVRVNAPAIFLASSCYKHRNPASGRSQILFPGDKRATNVATAATLL